ncbi:ABC transporter permease [Streptomyces longispororuber]|uniref:ABC transporter permease n=1 Tax=Streptomyces longispororuber TaxID=68230 RepID=UPI00210E59AE|nr:ABC transporter permease [Streptomyces longispororuber]MCQ4212483.1 ABC transporter permease [Streptomyces longispororuber]
MILKEFLELRRDRRTMAMIIALPLLLLVVFGYAANFTVDDVPTRVYGPNAQAVAGKLHTPFDVKKVDPAGTEEQARDVLRSQDAGAVVVAPSSGPATVFIDGSNLFSAQSVTAASKASGGVLQPEVLFNPELKTSWTMVPALVGMIMAFIGTIITAIGLVRERQAGTLEQLAVMPFKATDVIVGKIAPYFVLAAFDMVLVTVLGCLLFGVPFAGSFLVLALGAALFLFCVLGIGVLISSVSQNQGQAMQMALLTLMPQMLLSGMIFPLSAMAAGVRWIGYLFPLTYFNMVSNGVMLRDAPISSLALPLGLLAGMAVLVFSFAVLRFRRDLAPTAPKAARDAVAAGGTR